jgi:hypothetical protein
MSRRVVPAIGAATATFSYAPRIPASRIFHATQIRRLIAFASADDVTIKLLTNHDSEAKCF